MPTPVGQVFATFEIQGIQKSQDALKEVARLLDEINNKNIQLGGSLSKVIQQQSQAQTKSQKQAADDAVKAAEEAIARRARLERELTKQLEQEQKARLKTAQANAKAEESAEEEKAKALERIDKAHTLAIIEDQKRTEQAQKQSQQNYINNLKNLAAAGMAPAKAMETVSNTVYAIGRSMEHVGQITAIFGYRMSLVAKPLADFGIAGAKASIDLEESVTKAATQLDNLSPDAVKKFVDETSTELRNLSKQFPQTAKDMGEAVYYLVSTLTIDPAVARKFIEPISQFATAIKGSSEDAAKAVAPILNVYSEYATGADGVSKALGIMFETVRRGKGEAGDIARQFGDFLAYGKTAGASLSQQSAMFAQLSRVAGSPSEAATQMSALFRGLTEKKTVDGLEAIGVHVSDIVEGTGEWVKSTGNLDEKSQKAYESIISKLRGAEGVTGLYGQLNKAQLDLARNQTDYNAKQTTANARQLDDSKQKVATIRQQIAYYEQLKSDMEGGEGTLSYTGEVKRRDPLTIIADIGKYLDTFKDEQKKIEAINELFPNVRASRGLLSMFNEGAIEDARKWATEMENSTGRVAEAANLMGNTVEARLTKMQNTLLATGGELYDKFLKEKLLNILEYVNRALDAFNQASPDLKEFVIQMVALATAAGPVSLAFGTIMIGLAQFVNLVGFLASPVGLIAVGTALATLKGPLSSLKQGIDDAGGGLKGLATFAAQVAVQLGLVTQTDATKFLKDLGLYAENANLGKVKKDAEEFANKLKEVADKVSSFMDQLVKVVDFITSNYETLGLIVVSGYAITAIAKIELALASLRAAMALTAGAEGVGLITSALATLPATVTIAVVLVGVGAAIAAIAALNKQAGQVGRTKQGLNQATAGMGENDYNTARIIYDSLYDSEKEKFITDLIDARQESGFSGANRVINEYWFLASSRQASNSNNIGVGQSQMNGGDMDAPYYGTSSAWGMDLGMYDELYGASAIATASSQGAKPKGPKASGTTTPPIGVGGAVPFGKTMTPQEMAPGIFKQFGGEAWMGAFAQEHGGQDAYSYYAGQGYSDPIGAALRDKAWGDSFAKEHGGKGPEKGDWEAHWYETYGKTEVDELDAEGKPTGKKKTVIDKKGPMDQFSKMVEDAMKGITDKKDDLTKAYTDPPQALIDKKDDITKAYTEPVAAFVEAAKAAIAAINAATGRGGAGKPPADTSGDVGSGPGGHGALGDGDFGGPVVTSGVYRLLKGEYVVSLPEQRDIRAMMRNASSNSHSGGDAYNINVNGANSDPKAIAAAVMSELRWQKSRSSGKMIY